MRYLLRLKIVLALLALTITASFEVRKNRRR